MWKCECICWLLFSPLLFGGELDIGLIITVLTMFTWIVAFRGEINVVSVLFHYHFLLTIIIFVCSLRVLIASVHNCHLNFDSFYCTEPWWTVMLPWQQYFRSLRITRLPLAGTKQQAWFHVQNYSLDTSWSNSYKTFPQNAIKMKEIQGLWKHRKCDLNTSFSSYESSFPSLIFLSLFAIKDILNRNLMMKYCVTDLVGVQKHGNGPFRSMLKEIYYDSIVSHHYIISVNRESIEVENRG